MTIIVCDVCGAKLAIDKLQSYAFCTNCGLRYSIDDLKQYKALLDSPERQSCETQRDDQITLPEYEAARIVETALYHCENEAFGHAKTLFETALKLDKSCQGAYLGLLLVENKVRSETELDLTPIYGLDKSRFYKKAMAIGDDGFKKKLEVHAAKTKKQYERWREQKTKKATESRDRDAELRNAQQRLNQLSKMRFRVLDWLPEKECALVMSLEEIQYHSYDKEGSSGATWESCELRKWLNGDYFDGLPRLIRNHIVEVENKNHDTRDTPGGPDTLDKVFLLSVGEAKRFFKDDGDRKIEYGNKVDEEHDRKTVSGWWLRSPGGDPKRAAYVTGTGSVDTSGMNIGNPYTFFMFGDVSEIMMYTRPVFWLAIPSNESIQEEKRFARFEEQQKILRHVGNWIQVFDDHGESLFVAEAPVGKMPYNRIAGRTNWRDCSLRHWLNNEFYEMLPDELRSRIIEKRVITSGYSTYSGDISSTDRVFIMSKSEYERCSQEIKERLEDSLIAPVWLRDPMYSDDDGAAAMSGGGYADWPNGVDVEKMVRPAIWMKTPDKTRRADEKSEYQRLQDLRRWTSPIYIDAEKGIGLYLANDIVAIASYGDDYDHEPWSKCRLRKWLNEDYYNSLPEKLKSRIVKTAIETQGDETVSDKVFLLSDDEAEKYLQSDGKRIGCYLGWQHGWWLRSRVNHRVRETVYWVPDEHYYEVSYITAEGGISSIDRYQRHGHPGISVNRKLGVRPAMWMKLPEE